MIIQPFVENSVEHGFSGIDYTGNIRVYFSKQGKELRILIEDNGKGLITGNQDKEGHVSRASQIIRDRIYLLNIKLKKSDQSPTLLIFLNLDDTKLVSRNNEITFLLLA